MDMAAQYVVRLRQEAAEALQATAGDRTATQQQQLEAALSLLGETQEAAVAGLEVRRRWPCPHAPTPPRPFSLLVWWCAQTALGNLFERAWRSELRQALADAYRDSKFVLTEDEYDAWRTASDAQAAAVVLAEVETGARVFKVREYKKGEGCESARRARGEGCGHGASDEDGFGLD